MSPFWSGFFEHLRGCGRNGAIFVSALAAFFAVMIVAAIAEHTGASFNSPIIILICIAAVAVWITLLTLRSRKDRKPLRFGKLSEDEMRVARTRLKNAVRKS